MHFFESKYGIFIIAKHSDKAIYRMKLIEQNEEELLIDFLVVEGEFEG